MEKKLNVFSNCIWELITRRFQIRYFQYSSVSVPVSFNVIEEGLSKELMSETGACRCVMMKKPWLWFYLLVFANLPNQPYFYLWLQTGGPDWEVRLGRLDSLSASQEDSNEIMPSPRANASALIDLFQKYNLSVKDLVALSGSHSVGQGRCFSIMFRLYNQSGSGRPDPAIDYGYREELERLCPLDVDQNVTGNLDSTPLVFDNQYFKDLVSGRGFLNSDQTLFTFPQTREFVRFFSRNQDQFFKAFVEGMLKMGDLQSGRPGEVRTNCRVVNPRPAHLLFESQHNLLSNNKSIYDI